MCLIVEELKGSLVYKVLREFRDRLELLDHKDCLVKMEHQEPRAIRETLVRPDLKGVQVRTERRDRRVILVIPERKDLKG
jgi:hypothetical protein